MKKIKIILVALLSLLLGVFASCSVSDADYTIDHNFSLNTTSVELEIGQTFDIVASYGENVLSYSIDNKEVATVSETGKVTAIGSGVAYVTISAGEKSRQCKITVVQAEYTVEFIQEDVIIAVGTYKKLQVVFKRNGASYIGNAIWTVTGGILTSDNTSAWFFAEETGEYTVTVQSEHGAKANCHITVIDDISDLD